MINKQRMDAMKKELETLKSMLNELCFKDNVLVNINTFRSKLLIIDGRYKS